MDFTPQVLLEEFPSSTFSPNISEGSSLVPFDELPHIKPKNPRMNYTCPVCAKEIFNKADFRRHYMVHTGERPYPCPHCPYRARQLYNLKSHVSNKHPELLSSFIS